MRACLVWAWMHALRSLSRFSWKNAVETETYTGAFKAYSSWQGLTLLSQTVPELAFHFSLLAGVVTACCFGPFSACGPTLAISTSLCEWFSCQHLFSWGLGSPPTVILVSACHDGLLCRGSDMSVSPVHYEMLNLAVGVFKFKRQKENGGRIGSSFGTAM